MKTIFIPAKIKSKIDKPKIFSLSKKLPKNIVLAYSIQYQDIANEIKNILGKEKKITKFVQVLGCSKPKFSKTTHAILLISDGKFHGVSLAIQTKLPVYVLENNQLTKISKKDIEDFEKKQKASYVKFLNADKIGILVSTKPGQQNLKRALDFRKKLKNKKSYLFLGNNINVNEFENFGLDSWVNTECPRLDMNDNRIINLNKAEFSLNLSN
jgi:2-(3-amino-3-carboxypropyl)histidine synthase